MDHDKKMIDESFLPNSNNFTCNNYVMDQITFDTSDRCKIHKAKLVINWNGQIFNPEVLDLIDIDDIVRLSFQIKKQFRDKWSHDAPYVKIVFSNPDIIYLWEKF